MIVLKPLPRTFYFFFLIILLEFFLAEVALEYRHFKLGYSTPIFGTELRSFEQKNKDDILNKKSSPVISRVFGPTATFPFKSEVINERILSETLIWIASASHAEGGRLPATDVFPNSICQHLLDISGCRTVNGSKAGMTIQENIRLLIKHSSSLEPNIAILYQMSTAIFAQQYVLNQKASSPKVSPKKVEEQLLNVSRLKKLFQSFSLYIHLSDYIGGNIKLSGQLKESLPVGMGLEFESQVKSFISTCRENNIVPVLATFAASHNSQNIQEMHFSKRTNFVRSSPYLSPTGWVSTIKEYNQRIRKIAVNEQVDLIELEKALNGKSENFIDFVHFNKKGHAKVAKIIATSINSIFVNK